MPVILHGGGATAPETTRAFIRAAGGPDAPVVVLSFTSADPVAQGKRSADWLRENGAKNVVAPESPVKPAAEWEAVLAGARGVWIPGGDQSRLTAYFARTAVPAAIVAVVSRGGAVGGTSAGASLMGEWMPTGDGDRAAMLQDAVATVPGLSALRGVIVDSHFFARERLQRLVNMVASRPKCIGIGVDEKAWATVDPVSGTLTVESGQVALLHCPGPVTVGPEKRLGAAELRLRLLLPGQSAPLKP